MEPLFALLSASVHELLRWGLPPQLLAELGPRLGAHIDGTLSRLASCVLEGLASQAQLHELRAHVRGEMRLEPDQVTLTPNLTPSPSPTPQP